MGDAMVRQERLFASVLTVLFALAAPAPAQETGAPAADEDTTLTAEERKEQKMAEYWRDLIHYIKVLEPDAALSNVQALLELQPEPAKLYMLSEETWGSMNTITRGMARPELREPLQKLVDQIREGYRVMRTDPDRIKEALARLEEGPTAYTKGREQLIMSGEYAVPQMVQALMDPNSSNTLKSAIVSILPDLGKEAVRPLSVGLQTRDPKLRELFADALAQIEYPHALPRLKELLQREDLLPQTREAATTALYACAGGDKSVMQKSAASLFYEFGEKYYYRAESLLPDIRSPQANVWYWREGLGPVHIAVPREIFCDLYAKRMSRLALEHDPKFYPAVSLWLSASLNKEAMLPEGATDPLHQPDQPFARFYVLAASPKYLQDVLARALKDHNTPVAMGALRGLVETAGTKTLVEPTAGGAMPQVEALTYPDREVRFFAAVSLAKARPKEMFEGYQLVMNGLNSALRQSGKRVAMVVIEDLPQRNLLKDLLREMGYLVIEGDNVRTAMAAAKNVSGVDVAVLGRKPDAPDVITQLRVQPEYNALPVVVAGPSEELRQMAKFDERLFLTTAEPAADVLGPIMTEAIRSGVGRALTAEESVEWAVQAADAIRMLGLTGNKVFDILLTRTALIEALDDPRQPVRTAAARALAIMNDEQAQRAISRLANSAEVEAEVRIAAYDAMATSLQMHGRLLLDRHVKATLDVVTGEDPHGIREAAAKALGAMGLPSQDIIPLIADTAGSD
jgi:antitoxin component of RelBE/YafQ-DinJ toxin-antitoxin module